MPRIDTKVSRLAFKALQNQLELAVKLLQNAQKCREAVDREAEVIQIAREAYRHSMEALGKLPQFPKSDMDKVEETAREFHLALETLIRTSRAS